MRALNLAVAGLGYWGPNLARALSGIPGVTLRYGCDPDGSRRERVAKLYPGTRFTADFEELLADDELDAVVVATPAPTHAGLARRALLAGKDVFVEKPLALAPADAEEVVRLAEEGGRILMVGHLLEYHPAVVRLQELVGSGELGEILHVHTRRLNLGIVRQDENALWSLGAHDLSVVMRLVGEEPVEAQATGQSYLRTGIEDVVFGALRFAGGRLAHLHISWLDPRKERTITVVGSERMAVFDDVVSGDEKLRLYDKGARRSRGDHVALRFGDTVVVRLPDDEPLRLECEHFVGCLRERGRPVSDGRSGLRVVRALDALQRSLDAGGKPVSLEAARV